MYLENIFDKINIIPGDKILVHSNILNILIEFKKKNKKFNANLIIDSLIKKVGPNGTVIFAAYNWEFCRGKAFDYNKSQSMAGSLGSFALKRKDFRRTKNPIYSFAVTGKDKDYLCNLNHHNCFDMDSPFGYLIKNQAKMLFIGMDYKDGFTLCHIAEQAVGVNYRILKNFSGFYIDKFYLDVIPPYPLQYVQFKVKDIITPIIVKDATGASITVANITVSPHEAIIAPSACLATLPVSKLIFFPATSISFLYTLNI